MATISGLTSEGHCPAVAPPGTELEKLTEEGEAEMGVLPPSSQDDS